MYFLDLLRSIGVRPLMYVGDKPKGRCTIWHLDAFLIGYRLAYPRPDKADTVLDEFTLWVCTRYRVPLGSMNWAGHLWYQADKDEEAAFHLFFELLEPYIEDRNKFGPEAIKQLYNQTVGDN